MRFSHRDSGYGFCHSALRCVIGALCMGLSLAGAAWAQPRIPPLPVLPSAPVAGDASSTNTGVGKQVEFFDYTKMLGGNPATNGVPNNELKGRVYLPNAAKASGPYPVVVFLHGMHGVCGAPYNAGAKLPGGVENKVGMDPGYDRRALDPPGLMIADKVTPPNTTTAQWGFCPQAIYMPNGEVDPLCPPAKATAAGKTFPPRTCPSVNAGDKSPYGGVAKIEFPVARTWTEIPSYAGYDYLGTRLASQGYLCLSIDANLVNQEDIEADRNATWATTYEPNDGSRIRERGQLVLQHLLELDKLNQGTDTLPGGTKTFPTATNKEGTAIAAGFLKNQLDLTNVGLVGHSRGGEGVRAAYNLYLNNQSYRTAGPGAVAGSGEETKWSTLFSTPPVIKAIYEIAPTDAQAREATPLNATVSMGGNKVQGTAWNVLLPACDADVRNNAGIRPFDRMTNQPGQTETKMPTPKSVYAVWGANHNFFNQQWTISDTARADFSGLWTWTHWGCSVAPPEDKTNPHFFTNDVDEAFDATAKNKTVADPGAINQRTTTLSSVTALMLANVGNAIPQKLQALNQNFNTLFQTPTGARAVTNELANAVT